MTTKMGFEGQILQGPAGSEGTSLIENRTDVTITLDPERAPTTIAGDGVAVPINTSRVVALGWSCEWTMLNKPADTILEALRAAAAIGEPVALRMKDHASGKGYNGDVTISVENGKPLKGEQTFRFRAEPTDEAGRTPQLYV